MGSDGDDPEKRLKYNTIALDSVERGAQLSSRLLSFAKRQPGISKSHKIEAILKDFEALIAPTIESVIKIDFRIDDPDMSVFCDLAQLENAMLNLVLNARDAILRSGKGSEISISARSVTELSTSHSERDVDPNRYGTNALEAELQVQEDGRLDQAYRYIEFSVSDNGPGMTEDVKRRALDPFFHHQVHEFWYRPWSVDGVRIYPAVGWGVTFVLGVGPWHDHASAFAARVRGQRKRRADPA